MLNFKQFLESKNLKKGEGFGCLMAYLIGEIRSEALKLISKISEDHLYDPSMGFGKEPNPHITIKYGLHENDANIIFKELGDITPMEVSFRNISLFENVKFDVIKVGITSPDLRALNAKVCKLFKFTDKFPVYKPHMTLAYVQPGYGYKYLKLDNPLAGQTTTISKLVYSDAESNKTIKNL
jgi:2'-5' RNA ligase